MNPIKRYLPLLSLSLLILVVGLVVVVRDRVEKRLNPCVTTEYDQLTSPDKRYVAERVIIDCGATDGQDFVSLRQNVWGQSHDDVFTIIGSQGTPAFFWSGPRTLMIMCPKCSEANSSCTPVVLMKQRWKDVRIVYNGPKVKPNGKPCI